MAGFLDLTGQRFNSLTVVSRAVSTGAKTKWLCKCDCGNVITTIAGSLRSGNTKSCGCRRISSSRANGKNNRSHGMTATSEYKAWQSLKDRCYNPDAEQYKNYGARGIGVCDEWMNSFEAFYRDMGPKPGIGYSIDRIEVDGNYEPSNCRWATAEEQSNNKRSNVKLMLNGEELTIPQLSRKYKIPAATLASRIYRDKIPVDEAVKKQASHRKAQYKGEWKRLNEWVQELGIPYLKLYRHVTMISPQLDDLVGGIRKLTLS